MARRATVLWVPFLAAVLVVNGCGSNDESTQRRPTFTRTRPPTPTRTSPTSTQSPTATVPPTATATVPSTATATASATAVATRTPTATASAAATGTPTPTPTPTGETCPAGPVMTTSGTFCGKVETVDGTAVNVFLGMPYGESTGGASRWAPPIAKTPGQGTVQATQFGAVCPQPNLPATVPAASEDCLSMNVWSPASVSQTGRPVMVFIYGGAFVTGASAFPVYDSAYLSATQDVVVVTFNYRTGALGFLSGVGGLTGNYGFLDQQLALEWVKDNVAKFGGDPNRVTIFGESAGAMSVGLHLLAAPASGDLFTAAIMESNPLALPYTDPATAEQVGKEFALLVGCSNGNLECLRNVSVQQIISNETSSLLALFFLQEGFEELLVWAPIVDGTVITRQPLTVAQQEGFPKPVLLGTNRDEGTLFIYGILNASGLNTLSKDLYEQLLKTLFGEQNLAAILADYPAVDGDNAATASRLINDYMFFCANRSAADGGGGPVYAYQFDQVSTFNFAGIPQCANEVCHTDELPYVFHSATAIMQSFTPAEEALSKDMVAYWGNFGHPGHNPNGGSLVEWPAFPGKKYLLLGTPIMQAVDPPHNCGLWDSVGYLITPTMTPSPTPTPTP
jgi:carboxylesterase type B